MKRIAVIAGAAVLAALLAAHVVYWYLPRERPVTPRLGAGGGAALAPAGAAAGPAGGAAGGEPLQVLAAGAYDVCAWVPYPHQNLGALAAAIGDLQDVVGAAARLSSGEGGEASAPRPREPEEAPTFGPFEVPPASELVACSDLAGGRLRVAARIYPALAVVAKLAGRVAGNPWLAGGVAGGSTRISWQGRLWTVIAGPEAPRPPVAPPGTAAAVPAGSETAAAETAAGEKAAGVPVLPKAAAGAPAAAPAVPAAAAAAVPELPQSLAVVHWTGARPEIPAGYYALTRSGSDLSLSLVAAGGGAGAGTAAAPPGVAGVPGVPGLPGVPGVAGPLPSVLVAVGPDWRGVEPFAAAPGGAAASRGGPAVAGGLGGGGVGLSGPGAGEAARPPAALALFATSGSRLSTLGDLPGLAVFNAAPPGAAPGPVRWRLPTEGFFRLLAGRLPTSDLAGWRILALDSGSLRQAEALAPRLAALVPPVPAGVPAAAAGGHLPDGAGVPAGPGSPAGAGVPFASTAVVPTVAAPSDAAGRGALSLGIWLEPRSTLGIVTRIRRFVEKFPLASRRQVDLWRDWETVLDPLANCDHAVLAATASPPSMRLLLRGCRAASPR